MPFDTDCAAAPDHERKAAPEDRLAPLLARTAQGDRRAFRELYDLTSPKLMGVAMRLLGRRDAAEDALQDAYLRIWSKAGQFDPARGPALPWLARIVRNAALDQARLRADRLKVPLEHAERLPTPAIPMIERLALARAFEGLDAAKRTSVMLAYLDGFSANELATHLGVPLGTAKTWVRRGADRLRASLHD